MSIQHLDEEPPLQKELTWGLSYRDWRQSEEPVAIPPKHSPINMPFELCKALQQQKRKPKKKRSKYTSTSDTLSKSQAPKLSLEERSALPQDQYMELLAIPNYSPPKKVRRKKKKICCKCNTTFLCRPRLFQMAIPNKRYVWENWKTYQHFLPAEMLMRFDQILKSGDNLEPRIARCYFKQLQKEKRKELRRKRRRKNKKKLNAEKEAKRFVNEEAEELADDIVEFIKRQPLFVLNFQQMMTSNELLRFFSAHKVIKVGKRTTKDPFKKTAIEISDKLVAWIDKATSVVDIQPLDSKEQIEQPLEMPSMESLIEEVSEEEEGGEDEMEWEREGEDVFAGDVGEDLTIGEEEEGEIGEGEGEEGEGGDGRGGEGRVKEGDTGITDEEDIRRSKKDAEEEEDEEGEEESYEEESSEEEGKGIGKRGRKRGEGEGEDEGEEQFNAQKILNNIKIFNQQEDEGSIMDMLNKLDEDILEKLIQILSLSPPEFLAQQILPGVTYNDILKKLIQIRDGNLMDPERRRLFLEEKMIEWAKKNEPDKVDDKVLNKIHETAMILEEWFKDSNIPPVPPDKDIRKHDGQGGEDDGAAEEEEEDDEAAAEKRRRQLEKVDEDQEDAKREEDGQSKIKRTESGESVDIEGEEEFSGEEGMGEEGMDGKEGWRRKDKGGKDGSEDEDMEGEEEEDLEGLEGEEEGEAFMAGAQYGEAEEGEDEEDKIGELADQLEKLDSLLRIIKHHRPSQVSEHTPGTICCLSLKVWAVWLLRIANNAHNWTRWTGDIIRQVRHYAAIIRGDVTTPSGERQVLYKAQWRKFVNDTEEKVVAWRQYSKHVSDLSAEIMENFHGRPVKCCPKCLQDHLIKDVVTAHETLQALTEAINCADYWQRCLGRIVEQTSKFAEIDVEEEEVKVEEAASEESYIEIEEVQLDSVGSETSYASLLEIEELELKGVQPPVYEILELNTPPLMYEIEALQEPEVKAESAPETVDTVKLEKGPKKKQKSIMKKTKKR